MIIENEFDVAASPDKVFALMLDPERVATCIPGAQVTGRREDGSYDAHVTVKLGPVKMTYRGNVAIIESDPGARTAKMLAKGAEERGQGTAQATLQMAVAEREGGGSHVTVSADILVTGRVAQMGRGVMQDVARRMIGQMAGNMEALLRAARRPSRRTPSRRDHCWARSSPIARSASSVILRQALRSSGPLAALAGYALLSLAVFGRGVLREGAGTVVGSYGSDQASFTWSLAWWPHAIEHGLHPLLTDLVYAPDGWNLAWTSSIPGPSLLAWPLTAAVGPVATYDVLALAAPALAAWCTFLLCRELRTGIGAALAGGLVFGFGTYETAETLNHLNLALVFTLPLAGLAVARYLHGTLSDRRFVVLFALCVVGVFATFLETLFWATLGGAFALAVAIAFTHGSERARLARCLVLSALAYAVALVVAAPYLWVALAHPDPLAISGRGFELDLANVIVPTRVTALRPPSLDDLARSSAATTSPSSSATSARCSRRSPRSCCGNGGASRSHGCWR